VASSTQKSDISDVASSTQKSDISDVASSTQKPDILKLVNSSDMLSNSDTPSKGQEEKLKEKLVSSQSIENRLAETGGQIEEIKNLEPFQLIPGAHILGKPYNIFGEYASELSVMFEAAPIFKDFYEANYVSQPPDKDTLLLDNVYTSNNDGLVCERINQNRFLCPKIIKVLHLSNTEGGYYEVASATDYTTTLQTASNIFAGVAVPVGGFGGSVKKDLNLTFSQAAISRVSCKHTYINLYGLKLALPNTRTKNITNYLHPDFLEDVNELNKKIKSLKEEDTKNLVWEFFNRYSPYFVSGIVLGGRCSINTTYTSEESVTTEKAKEQTELAFSLISQKIDITGGAKEAKGEDKNKLQFSNKFNVTYRFFGGDAQYGSCVLEKGYARWATSVYKEPVFVNFIQEGLSPIWEILPQELMLLKETMKESIEGWIDIKLKDIVEKEIAYISKQSKLTTLLRAAKEKVRQHHNTNTNKLAPSPFGG